MDGLLNRPSCNQDTRKHERPPECLPKACSATLAPSRQKVPRYSLEFTLKAAATRLKAYRVKSVPPQLLEHGALTADQGVELSGRTPSRLHTVCYLPQIPVVCCSTVRQLRVNPPWGQGVMSYQWAEPWNRPSPPITPRERNNRGARQDADVDEFGRHVLGRVRRRSTRYPGLGYSAHRDNARRTRRSPGGDDGRPPT